MTTDADRASRVVLALDDADNRDFALELACHVALTATPEIYGLFVENARLLEHARSRLAREFMFTGRERPLEKTTLERQLRAQTARARARFESAASRLGIRHTFQATRGEIAAELVQCAAQAEALVVSIARRNLEKSAWLRELFGAPLPLVLLAQEGWLSGRNIAVVVDGSAAAEAALDTAVRLAIHSHSPITMLLTGSAAEDPAAYREQIATLGQTQGIRFDGVIELANYDLPSIVQAAQLCRARLLVLASPLSQTDVELIEDLLRRLPSALVLVRR